MVPPRIGVDCIPALLNEISQLALEKYVEEAVGAVVEGLAKCKTEESRVSLERGVEFLAESLCGRIRRGPVSCVKVWLLDTSLKRHTALLVKLRSSLNQHAAVPALLNEISPRAGSGTSGV
jgi:hypothetical protein